MKQLNRLMIGCAVFLSATTANAQMGAPAPSAASADVYHVHFTKAVPGKAAELGKLLETTEPPATTPGHFIVLRHQQGDDWDYAVISHRGAKATVETGPAAPNPARDLQAWHTDTFVLGPSWSAFSKEMGLDAADKAKPSVYSVAVWRAVPGHREQLEKALAPGAGPTAPAGSVVLTHLEGGPWQYLAIARSNSWQDFAAQQAAGATGTAAAGWADVRAHGSYHHDTLADRIAPK